MTIDHKKIECSGIWKVFGPEPDKIFRGDLSKLDRAEIQKTTGHVIGVNDASFEISEGETFVVMGLSGSGKSTLVRCISRLIEPTRGEVLVDGPSRDLGEVVQEWMDVNEDVWRAWIPNS
jgi:glycine betaine/proline transport system ATP-binding protein